MDNAIDNAISRKKWSKPEKIYLPLILDNQEDNQEDNQIDTPDNPFTKISRWRLKTHKFINISYNKRSKKIRT